MNRIYILLILVLALMLSARGQTFPILKGKVFDALSKEPLSGVAITEKRTSRGTTSAENGSFILTGQPDSSVLLFSCKGYDSQMLRVNGRQSLYVALQPKAEGLETVVITANREAGLRTETAMAISKITPMQLDETKASLLVELINKVPGVVMLNYNNEQHGMGIRQPFGTSPYFLYLEDGIPLRPLGLFNHNALIETNLIALSSVEVIRGPASSMYGAEAVGGTINFITRKPTAVPTVKIGLQADNYGYQRLQWGAGAYLNKKLGVFSAGFVARQTDGWQSRSDYNKLSLNVRADYYLSAKTELSGNFSTNSYYSETSGSVDSLAYYSRSYSSNNNFTFRSVAATRASLKLLHTWNKRAGTELSTYYRYNLVDQNPSYSIRWNPGSTTAYGEINGNSFHSTGMIARNSWQMNWLNTKVLIGASADISPNRSRAYKTELSAVLRPDQRSVEQYTLIREMPEQLLTDYQADIFNSAAFAQVDFNLVPRVKISIGGRYDRMAFTYHNFLDLSSGDKAYDQITPKAGITADLGHDRWLYANYSKGFSPPALSAIFRKNTTIESSGNLFYYNLKPAVFNSIELGGWAAFIQSKLYLDWAVYKMTGHHELLNIRQPDGSSDYQSAGRTLHKGIEYSITYTAGKQWVLRFGGTNAIHRFLNFSLSDRSSDALKNVNGNDMPQAPKWVANTELNFKPGWVRGLRLAAEWQAISSWYQNQANTVEYRDPGAFGFNGISVINFRSGYQIRQVEIFVNVLNLSNEHYASSATRGNKVSDRSSYTPAAPRTFSTGIQYNFTGKK